MDLSFFNTVIYSVDNVLSTMARLKLKSGKATVRPAMKESVGVVTGLISMTGRQAQASVALSFDKDAILFIANRMLPDEHTTVDHIIVDLAGELANMVIGDAKRQLEDKGFRFDVSLPIMIVGEKHLIAHKSTAPVIVVPFEMEKGVFAVEAVFEKRE